MKAISVLAIIFLSSCAMQNQDVVRRPKEDGSIETVISVKHHNTYDILFTTHKVWVNGYLDKTIVQTDTLKSLGASMQIIDDGFGAAEKRSIRKNYEIYITVK